MFTKIAVATDGSSLAEKAVHIAAELAAKCGSELIVLHVLMHGEPPAALRRMAEVENLVSGQPHLQEVLGSIAGKMPAQLAVATVDVERHRFDHQIIEAIGEKIVERAKQDALESAISAVDGKILEGDSADEIIRTIENLDVDLIVLGSRGLSPLKGLLMGSVSQQVLEKAHCNCLIVK